jgi:hypothetical protein
MSSSPPSPNPRRVAAGRRNRAKRGPLTDEAGLREKSRGFPHGSVSGTLAPADLRSLRKTLITFYPIRYCVEMTLGMSEGCRWAPLLAEALKREGLLSTMKYEAEKFTRVVMTGNGKVIVKQTGKEAVNATGERAALMGVIVSVKDGTLYLTGSTDTEILVEVARLDGLTLTGNGAMKA